MAPKIFGSGLDDVVNRLKQKASHGSPASAQIFVKDSVPSSEVAAVAESIVSNARKSLKLSPDSVHVGKVRSLAKSFSVTSDVADVFAAIASQSDVKSMLESEQTDIFPRPIKHKLVG